MAKYVCTLETDCGKSSMYIDSKMPAFGVAKYLSDNIKKCIGNNYINEAYKLPNAYEMDYFCLEENSKDVFKITWGEYYSIGKITIENIETYEFTSIDKEDEK